MNKIPIKSIAGLLISMLLMGSRVNADCYMICEWVAYKEKAEQPTTSQGNMMYHCTQVCFGGGGPDVDPGDGDDSEEDGPTLEEDPIKELQLNPPVPTNKEHIVDCLEEIVAHTERRSFAPEGMPGEHSGVDLFAPNGTVVRSPVDGVVKFVEDKIPRNHNIAGDAGYSEIGNVIEIEVEGWQESTEFGDQMVEGAAIRVIIDHLDPGFASYDHENFTGVHEGMVVEKGQILAFSDNTGRTNIEPHVHHMVKMYIPDTGVYVVDPEKISDCPGGSQ